MEQASRTLAAEIAQERQARVAKLKGYLLPGALFAGTASLMARADPHRVIVELNEVSPATGHVFVVLRNDGGWTDARPLQGGAVIDPEGERCLLTLGTRAEERIPEGHPLLDQYGDWTLSLDLRPEARSRPPPPAGAWSWNPSPRPKPWR